MWVGSPEHSGQRVQSWRRGENGFSLVNIHAFRIDLTSWNVQSNYVNHLRCWRKQLFNNTNWSAERFKGIKGPKDDGFSLKWHIHFRLATTEWKIFLMLSVKDADFSSRWNIVQNQVLVATRGSFDVLRWIIRPLGRVRPLAPTTSSNNNVPSTNNVRNGGQIE